MLNDWQSLVQQKCSAFSDFHPSGVKKWSTPEIRDAPWRGNPGIEPALPVFSGTPSP
jgi:hypothetical protein